MSDIDRRALAYIADYLSDTGGVAPSVREIALALGERTSTSAVHKLLRGLESRGLIRRIPRRSRALELIRPTVAFVFDDASKTLRPLSDRPP